jgi:hypothetical protein
LSGNGLDRAIANTRPLTIAGRGNCDQIEITRDHVSGELDDVRIETSSPRRR